MKKVAIYARVSSFDGRQSQSIDAQLTTLRQYCNQRGLKIYREYRDELSGARDDRPEYQALRADARRMLFDGVVVFRFDRFSRSTKALLEVLEEFRTLGIDFVSYSEAVDTSTPMGKCMYTVIAAFSSLERDVCRERILHGLKNSSKKSGAPRKQFDTAQALQLSKQGWGCRRIGKALGVSYGTIYAYLKGVERGGIEGCKKGDRQTVKETPKAKPVEKR
jgi:DNA invertase Pin-like site-specific DNA recombinase